MAMIFEAREIEQGRYRVCGRSDEEQGWKRYELCMCEEGHESEQAARACPSVVNKLDRILSPKPLPLSASDEKHQKRIERGLEFAIRQVLDNYGEEGCYWHPPGLAGRMSRAAMMILETATSAADRADAGL